MALTGMVSNQTEEYVCKLDPSRVETTEAVDADDPTKGVKTVVTIEEDATKFMLSPLDVFLTSKIYDKATSLTTGQGETKFGFQTNINQTNVETVRHGLKGWSNFTDQTGNEIPFNTTNINVGGRSYTVVSDDSMNALGIRLIAELATEIKERGTVSEREVKNSG